VGVASYDLVLDLTIGPDIFSSRAEVRFRCRREGGTACADVRAVSIRRVTLNGADLDVAESYRGGRLELPAVPGENTLVVDALFAYVQAGEGLYRSHGYGRWKRLRVQQDVSGWRFRHLLLLRSAGVACPVHGINQGARRIVRSDQGSGAGTPHRGGRAYMAIRADSTCGALPQQAMCRAVLRTGATL
jgi:hypothetical protein